MAGAPVYAGAVQVIDWTRDAPWALIAEDDEFDEDAFDEEMEDDDDEDDEDAGDTGRFLM